jgi:hypothetical protein
MSTILEVQLRAEQSSLDTQNLERYQSINQNLPSRWVHLLLHRELQRVLI